MRKNLGGFTSCRIPSAKGEPSDLGYSVQSGRHTTMYLKLKKQRLGYKWSFGAFHLPFRLHSVQCSQQALPPSCPTSIPIESIANCPWEPCRHAQLWAPGSVPAWMPVSRMQRALPCCPVCSSGVSQSSLCVQDGERLTLGMPPKQAKDSVKPPGDEER